MGKIQRARRLAKRESTGMPGPTVPRAQWPSLPGQRWQALDGSLHRRRADAVHEAGGMPVLGRL